MSKTVTGLILTANVNDLFDGLFGSILMNLGACSDPDGILVSNPSKSFSTKNKSVFFFFFGQKSSQ